MGLARLPTEVWEVVIDFSCCEDHYRRYETLRACALTCRAWLPRSRYNLFRRVRFRRAGQIDRFHKLITLEPTLADMVRELHVTPAEPHKHGYFGFASAPLVQKLRNVRQMSLSEIRWATLPPTYFSFIAKFTHVAELEISNIIFHSARDFVRLLWCFPQLAQLECGLNHFTQPASQEDCEKLIALRKPSACSKLSYLALWGLDKFPPVLPALGCSVVDLFLHQPDASWPWDNVCESVSCYSNLRSLTLSLCVGLGLETSKALRDVNEKDDALLECKEKFTSLLWHISSHNIRTIFVRLVPSLLQAKSGGKWNITYRSSRSNAIALMLGEELKALLSSGPLSNLDSFHIYLQDNDLTRDAIWWCTTLRSSLGPRPREIRVDIDYFSPDIPRGRYDYTELWYDDPIEPNAETQTPA